MTPTNYDKHFKVLGKLCKLYDAGTGADQNTLKQRVSRLYDQAATGETDSYGALVVLAGYVTLLDNAITYAPDASLRATAINAAKSYLTAQHFWGDLTTVPTDKTSAASVLAALRTEMGASVDNKKLTTEAATGLTNFFKNILAAGGTWNTVADATADYKDSVYVVDAIVP